MELFETTKNDTQTDNGTLSHISSPNACACFFPRVGGKRSKKVEDFKNLYRKPLEEDEKIFARALLHPSEIREGAGDRQAFKDPSPKMLLTSRLLAPISGLNRRDGPYSFRTTHVWPVALDKIHKRLRKEENSLSAKRSTVTLSDKRDGRKKYEKSFIQ